MAQTIWLLCKSSHLLALDHCCMDGHFLYAVWQPEWIAASLREKQEEICYKVQMAWHLNMLPSGMLSLKDVTSDK